MCEHVVEPRAKPYEPGRDDKPEGYWKRDKNKSVNFDNPNHDRLMGISKYLRILELFVFRKREIS